MGTDVENVRRIVATAMDNQAKVTTNFIEVLKLAWIELRERRQQPGGSTDLDLAAAEHYLFARFLVASGEVREGQMETIVEVYYNKKLNDSAKGNANAMAVTANPVSKPDKGVMNWGLLGAKHGAADHTKCRVSKRPPLWRSIDDLLPGPGGLYGSIATGQPTP